MGKPDLTRRVIPSGNFLVGYDANPVKVIQCECDYKETGVVNSVFKKNIKSQRTL
jgi:hypothetical protein